MNLASDCMSSLTIESYNPNDRFKIWIEPCFCVAFILLCHLYSFLSDTAAFIIVGLVRGVTVLTNNFIE